MNRTVPTLLGVIIILMVGVLVLLIYDYKLTSGLAMGNSVVGTVGGEMLTGVDQPTTQIGASEARSRSGAKTTRIDPSEMQRRNGRMPAEAQGREGRRGKSELGRKKLQGGPEAAPRPAKDCKSSSDADQGEGAG
jgi:hypothetical protein